MHIRVLGSVTATTGDGTIALGGPRVRALLAALVLARGRLLSHETLLSDVWGTATPGVRSALRANVSRLRATPLGPWLMGSRNGYMLAPGPGLDVDLWRIDALAQGSERPTADALAHLERLIDAVPFDGIGVPPFLIAARASARLLVRRALVRTIDAEAQHPLALPAVERLIAHGPDDPELRALLVATRTLRGALASGRAPDSRRPAPAVATRRVGVPAPIAAFQPRPEDESRLRAALRLTRLVTIVGPAGVGKTRLAVEWARGEASSTQEHIWFCRADGGLHAWLRGIAGAVGAEDSTVPAVAARLHPLRGTIVLDGLDDEADAAAPALAALLENAPGVTALVTARRALGIPGESVQPVAALSTVDARALFRLRAGVRAREERIEGGDVDDLMAALGRLPLAIELAAARAAVIPLSSVLDDLSSPDEEDSTGALDAALAGTMALLTPSQQETLTRLCVFQGPFSTDSALARGGVAAERDLPALIGWALVADESRGGLALLRVPEVVRRRLPPAMATSAEDRAWHRGWFAARTLAAFHELTTAEASAAWQRLDAERADIDTAFASAVAERDRASALGIAAGMAWAGLGSGTQAAVLALARTADSVPGDAPAAIAARAQIGHGILAYQLGFMHEARSVLEKALALSGETGEPDLVAQSHAFLAYLATLDSDGTSAAVRSIRSARELLEDSEPSTQAMITLISAQVERSRGERERALHDAATAKALAERSGHAWVMLMSDVVAAKVLLDGRDPRGALDLLRSVLEGPRVLADPISVLITVSVAAGAAAGVGADAVGARIVGAVDAIGPRYGFDPRANEPADFERYRRRLQQGLTSDAWEDAYARGTDSTLAQLVDLAAGLAVHRAGSRRKPTP